MVCCCKPRCRINSTHCTSTPHNSTLFTHCSTLHLSTHIHNTRNVMISQHTHFPPYKCTSAPHSTLHLSTHSQQLPSWCIDNTHTFHHLSAPQHPTLRISTHSQHAQLFTITTLQQPTTRTMLQRAPSFTNTLSMPPDTRHYLSPPPISTPTAPSHKTTPPPFNASTTAQPQHNSLLLTTCGQLPTRTVLFRHNTHLAA